MDIDVRVLPHYQQSHVHKAIPHNLREPCLPLEITVKITCKEDPTTLGLSYESLEVSQHSDKLCVIIVLTLGVTRKVGINDKQRTAWEGKLGGL